ncbi:hypothetical protein ABK040_008368 [Willaertia magna]
MKRLEREFAFHISDEQQQETKLLKRQDGDNKKEILFTELPVDLIEEILSFHYIQFYLQTFKYYLKEKRKLKLEMFLFTCFGKKEDRIINLWKNVKIYDPILFYNEFQNQSVNPFLKCNSIVIKGENTEDFQFCKFLYKLFESHNSLQKKRQNFIDLQNNHLNSSIQDIPSSMKPLVYLRLEKLIIHSSNDYNLDINCFPILRSLKCHLDSFFKDDDVPVEIKDNFLKELIVECDYNIYFNTMFNNLKIIRFTKLCEEMLKPLEILLNLVERAYLVVEGNFVEYFDLFNEFYDKIIEIGLQNVRFTNKKNNFLTNLKYEKLLPKIVNYSGNYCNELENCKNLKVLKLLKLSYTTLDLTTFTKLQDLSLNLIYNQDYSFLLQLNNLTKLSLGNVNEEQNKSKGLPWLQLLNNLKKLQIDDASVLQYLPPNLTTLIIDSYSKVDICDIIENYPNIIKLRVKTNVEVESGV